MIPNHKVKTMKNPILYLSLFLMISCNPEQPVKKENIKSYIGKYAGNTDYYEYLYSVTGIDSTTGWTIHKDSPFLSEVNYNSLIIEIEADSATKLPFIDVGKVLPQLDWFYKSDFHKPIKLFLDDEGVVKLDTTFLWLGANPSRYVLRIDVDSANMWLNGTFSDLLWEFKLSQDSLQIDSMQVIMPIHTEKATLIKNPKLIDLLDLN